MHGVSSRSALRMTLDLLGDRVDLHSCCCNIKRIVSREGMINGVFLDETKLGKGEYG